MRGAEWSRWWVGESKCEAVGPGADTVVRLRWPLQSVWPVKVPLAICQC